MAAALLIYLAKKHLCRPVPGHLGKLIDGRNQQRRQAAVNLFIDNQHGQAFWSIFTTESAAAQWVATVDKRAAASFSKGFDDDISACFNGSAAPRTVGELAR